MQYTFFGVNLLNEIVWGAGQRLPVLSTMPKAMEEGENLRLGG